MEKIGIQNLKEVVEMGARSTIAVHAVTSDGFQLTDMTLIYPAAMSIPPAIDDIQLVDDEIEDMDETEKAGLIAFTEELLAEMNFVSNNVKESIMHYVNAAIHLSKGTLLLIKK